MNKDKDLYYIECINDLSKEMLISLTNFYLPLIGKDSLSLYLCLYTDSVYNNINPINKLFNGLGMYENTFMESLHNLEEYNLIKSYKKNSDDREIYIFSVLMPLTTYEFCKDDIYSRLLLKRIGKENYQLIKSIITPVVNKKEYTEITKAFDISKTIDYSQYDDEMYKLYNQKEPNDKVDDSFNINKFMSMCDDFTYPFKARTLENNALIKKYADIYGISYNEMQKFVLNASDYKPMQVNGELIYFSKNKFLSQINKYRPNVIYNEDPYKMLPMHFLQTLQQDGNIPYAEREIIEYLSTSLKFSNEIVNCIVEFVLNNNNNKLILSYVISLASPLKKFNVKSYDEAKEKLTQILSSNKIRKYQNTIEKPNYKENDFNLTDEEQKVYNELLKRDDNIWTK